MKKLLFFISLLFIITSCGPKLTSPKALDDYSFNQAEVVSKKDKSLQNKKNPIEVVPGFIWGINGHTINSLPYFAENSLEMQYNIINELQINYYRINVITDENGQVTKYPKYTSRWKETLEKSIKHNVKILPVFHLKDYDFKMTEEQAYRVAKKKAFGFANAYKDYFDYYELGNERDHKLILPGTNGDKIEHYDLEAFDVMNAYFKGLYDGVKEADPTAKTMISASGWKHWGFYEYLQQQNVPYDIISWHWYSNQGTIFNPLSVKTSGEDVPKLLHERFNKPIWITEINQKDGTYRESEDNMAFWNNSYIDELKDRDYIKAFMIYELLDQYQLDDNEGYEIAHEAYYGLIKWNQPYTAYSYKSAAITYKYKIEDITYGSEDYLIHLYETFDRKKLNTKQLKQDAALVKDVKRLATYLELFLSTELFISEMSSDKNIETQKETINRLYTKILKRDASPENLKHWQKKLKKKMSLKEISKSLLMSKEFYQNAVISGYEKRTGFPFYREGVYNINDQK